MSTILVWLLVSTPGHVGTTSNVPTTLIERFATADECERVRRAITPPPGKWETDSRQPLRCVQANIVRNPG